MPETVTAFKPMTKSDRFGAARANVFDARRP